MALSDDLQSRVKEIFKNAWTTADGQTVPSDTSLTMGNSAIKLKATVLYADLADSTKLVDAYKPHFAAEIYKAFLHCAGRIITSEGGTITSYDGDRIMAVFIGDYRNTRAVRAALKINWATKNIVQPAKNAQYTPDNYSIRHVCGIDSSELHVAKTGIRGSNDLVWVGRSANYAAKLSALDDAKPTWITNAVYDVMKDEVKVFKGTNMWVPHKWTAMNDMQIYASTYWWSF